MKKLLTFAVAASAMFAFTGCTKDAVEPINPNTESSREQVTITATVEQPEEETRTSLSNSKVLWTAGDKIRMVLSTSTMMNDIYTLATGAGTTIGTFTGANLGAGVKWGYYPNSSYNSASDYAKTVTVKLPTSQVYASGSFGNEANPMIAKSDANGANLAFKNLCGAIRLQLKGNVTIKQITVTSVSEALSGQGTIDMTYSSNPVLTMATDMFVYKYVTLAGINETLDPTTAKPFTIVLPAGQYAAGMEIAITTSTGDVMYQTTQKALTVERSKVTPLAPFAYASTTLNFPDKAFRTYLVLSQNMVLNAAGTDIDMDHATNKGKFTSLTSMNAANKGISSLKGIENFKALKTLNCYGNQLSSLDVSKNTTLTTLSCYSNQLSSLDVSALSALGTLNCYNNPTLSSLIPSTSLTMLMCYKTALTSLNLSVCTKLSLLACYSCKLTSLTLPATATLTLVNCFENKLTALDLTGCPNLETVGCYKNHIQEIDLRSNTKNILPENLLVGDQTTVDGNLTGMNVKASASVQTSDIDTNNPFNARSYISKY